eukprot:TRINITY_DN23782_c0_g1_i2.p1 TRINITY_DN23782_c0_g1~~TRINITY_DN23782_c0_g1_i2.p1  ORF type:complete len:631 (-),score=200.39 TRINITY_DN23782_c0_g1_i2:10-1902(-)
MEGDDILDFSWVASVTPALGDQKKRRRLAEPYSSESRSSSRISAHVKPQDTNTEERMASLMKENRALQDKLRLAEVEIEDTRQTIEILRREKIAMQEKQEKQDDLSRKSARENQVLRQRIDALEQELAESNAMNVSMKESMFSLKEESAHLRQTLSLKELREPSSSFLPPPPSSTDKENVIVEGTSGTSGEDEVDEKWNELVRERMEMTIRTLESELASLRRSQDPSKKMETVLREEIRFLREENEKLVSSEKSLTKSLQEECRRTRIDSKYREQLHRLEATLELETKKARKFEEQLQISVQNGMDNAAFVERWKDLFGERTRPHDVAKELDSLREAKRTFEQREHDDAHHLSVAWKVERDSLKQRIVDLENTVQANERAMTSKEKANQRLQTRVDILVSERKNMIRFSDDKGPGGSEELENRIKELEKSVAERDHENSGLVKEVEKQADYIRILESRVGRGDYDPRQTKILKLAVDPRKMEPKKKGVAEELPPSLPASSTSSGSCVPSECSKCADLQRRLEESEKMNRRLKNVFSQKTKEFRSACERLCGWNIVLKGEKEYKLRSIFAASEEDFLLFHVDEDTEKMLETPYATSLEAEIRAYLERLHNIPAFLCAITQNLFENSTFHAT